MRRDLRSGRQAGFDFALGHGPLTPNRPPLRRRICGAVPAALDESRLLILGAQVLFGFQFEAVFQELFPEIPTSSRYIHCAVLVIGLLIAPSLLHQIMFDGESRPATKRANSIPPTACLVFFLVQ